MDRFWSKVDIRSDEECWVWTGHRHTRGYGIFWHAGKNVRANRFALELEKGPSPFEGAMALHSCDNPPCCNPSHLRWGTNLENSEDKIMRKGDSKGENSPVAILTNEKVDLIYRLRLEGMTIGDISEKLGAPYTTVENVYVGKAWAHRLGVDGNPTLEELRRSKPTRKPSPFRALTDEMVDHILRSRMEGRSAREIASEIGLPLGTVSPVHSGLAYTHRLGVNGNPTLEELRSVSAPNPTHKLTEDDKEEIRSLLSQGYWGSDIAKKYGVSKATISNIKNGKR